MLLTYRYRLKDGSRSTRRRLRRMARAVNAVWNYCGDAQKHALRHNQKWPRAFDLNNLVAGSSKLLGLHSQTVQAVCEKYAANREATRRPRLRYRGHRSLGWVPFKVSGIRRDGAVFIYLKRRFRCWLHRDLPEAGVIRCGSFAEDACGNWYINITVELPDHADRNDGDQIGVDLGLKYIAVLSTGEKIENPRHLSKLAGKLSSAQRARKRRLAARTHRKIARCRRDHLHKASRKIADRAKTIFVGDVSACKLGRTRMAKSALDAGWSSFKNMLSYKAIGRGGMMICVAEHGTSRSCSHCGDAESGPKGIAEIGVRQWTCSSCGAKHDRDINAARNIARRGLATLNAGAPTFRLGSSHTCIAPHNFGDQVGG